MSTNISKQHREDLLDKIRQIRSFIASAPQDANTGNLLQYLDELTKDVKGKKYGLVFEQHREQIDEILDTHTTVLTEQKDLFIDNGGEMNFLIEGDNLAALQLLEKTHKAKIDVIYIDPPYNTRKEDFIYDDNYVSRDDSFRHSKWCSFIKKRLVVANNLLSYKGVIFLSIDDNEYANLKMLCDEVFGESNFVGDLILKTATDNNPSQINIEHEYMLCFAKDKTRQGNWERTSRAATRIIQEYKKLKNEDLTIEEVQTKLRKWINLNKEFLPQVTHYNNVDEKGVYSSSSNSSNPHPGGYMYDILHPITGKPCPKPQNGWRWPLSTFQKYAKAGEIKWGEDETTQPHVKKRIETATEYLRTLIYEDNRGSTNALADIFSGKKVFDNPKPTTVLSRIIDFSSSKESTILDFFAGSGTTGHAVMKLNSEDGGHRKFILCTNNENNICRDVTYERLKTVITGKRKDGSEYNEHYDASLKYFKIDFVPISDKLYYEYADELLLHIRELVELENGINFNGNNRIAIVLSDEEMEQFVATANNQTKVLYRGHDVLLTDEQEEYLKTKGVKVNVIPDYYYNELNR